MSYDMILLHFRDNQDPQKRTGILQKEKYRKEASMASMIKGQPRAVKKKRQINDKNRGPNVIICINGITLQLQI